MFRSTYKRKRAMSVRRRRPAKRLARRTVTRKRRTLSRRIKDVVLRTTEKKAVGSIFNNSLDASPETFTTIQLSNIANDPTSASSKAWNYKSGQEYFIEGFNIGISVGNKVLTPGDPYTPTYCRVMILEASRKGATDAPTVTSLMWRGVDLNNVAFNAIAKLPQSMWYGVDPKYYKTVFNRIVKIGANGDIDHQQRKWWVPNKTKITTMGILNGEQQQSKTYYLIIFGFQPFYNAAGGGAWNLDYQHQTLFRDP